MIFIKEEAGYRYLLNSSKPNTKFRLGQIYQGIRKRLSDHWQQKILITKYSMISQKTVDNLKKNLQIITKIRDSANIPSSILKYYGYLYNLAQSNLYIISQYFDKFIPLELKELHPVNLITIVSNQILSAFQYLQSIQLFTTYFNIFINDNLQVKIFDFGFEFAVDSLNFQYQAQSNACVDWVWGYIPSQKNKQIYDEFVKENLVELNDQKLEKQKTQKLYSWLYGLIIYNKMCSTLLSDQKYRIKRSTGEYWYPWSYLLKCLFIKKQFIDYNKNYKMISRDIVNILKEFENSYSSSQIMQNMMEQDQIPSSEQTVSKYFQFFTHSPCIQRRQQYTIAQIQSGWIKMIVELLKKYVFQPFNRRATVSEVKQIIHGSSLQNDQLYQQITKFYLITHLQKQNKFQQIQRFGQQNSNKLTLQILWKSEEDLQLKSWLRRFELEPENQIEKMSKKKVMKTVSEKKKIQENAKQILIPYLQSIYVNKKELKKVNGWLMNRLKFIDLYEQMFKNMTSTPKQSMKIIRQGYRIANEQNYRQLQYLKPLIKQLILIGIYLEIISILNGVKYERNLHQKIKHTAISQLQKNNYLTINLSIMDVMARQQSKYNGQVCLYVKIRHSLKIKLNEIHKMLCQYNYLMDSYLCKYTEKQQHMGDQQTSIERRYLQTFFKKVTNLIVITKIHEKVLSLEQFQQKNNRQNLLQFYQLDEQYRKVTNMFGGYAQHRINSIQIIDDQNKLKNNEPLLLSSYFLQLITLIMLGCAIRIRQKEQIKMVEGINSHTITFITSFLKQNREIIENEEELIQVEKDIKKLKKVVQYLIISDILIPSNPE